MADSRPTMRPWTFTRNGGGVGRRLRTIDGSAIRFAESGGRAEQALLLKPWPESLYAFEPIWPLLAEHPHLVAIDLPGFGRSEGRDRLMAPHAMGEFVIHAADAFGLERDDDGSPLVRKAERYARSGTISCGAVSKSAQTARG